MSKQYDKIVIGAGLYGLYAALFCAKRGEHVLVLEREEDAFCRATYINQARVHMGYHYPRSISTALKSKGYFERFVRDYSFCIADEFLQVYATAADFSWTDKKRFEKFCRDAEIPCDAVSPDTYFNAGLCDGAYVTKEYAYDAMLLKEYLLTEINLHTNVEICFHTEVTGIARGDDLYRVTTGNEGSFETPFLLNATYAGCNEMIELAGCEPLQIKYELCEIILCEAEQPLQNLGITVMDGPFFSIMPFGKTGLHSLTSVTFTPHRVSYDPFPTFECQKNSGGKCRPESLFNCNLCDAKPKTAYPYMEKLAKKFLLSKFGFFYKESLFSMKPILTASEIDDSRPTVVRKHSRSPSFVSVLSGKINTVYDLDEVLSNG